MAQSRHGYVRCEVCFQAGKADISNYEYTPLTARP